MADNSIQPVKDGPYVVSGDIAVLDSDGNPVDASANTFKGKIYLCRCGQSSTKPFCDGTHQKVGFQHEFNA